MLCSICIVQIRQRNHFLNHAEYTAPTRAQHEVDHTDHLSEVSRAMYTAELRQVVVTGGGGVYVGVGGAPSALDGVGARLAIGVGVGVGAGWR